MLNIGYCYRMDGKNILYNECLYILFFMNILCITPGENRQ